MKKKIAGLMLMLLGLFFTFVPAWILFGKKGLDFILCVLLAILGTFAGTIGVMLIGMKEENPTSKKG